MPDQHSDIRYFLYEHMHEESGHEQWVLNDLQAVGIRESRLRRVSLTVTSRRTLCGYNYWCADRQDPSSVLGMMYALEVIASVYGGPFSSAIRESLLLEDDRGMSFISSHASMDTEHMVQLRQVLNTLEDSKSRDAVVESTIVNFNHFTRMFEAL